MKEDWNEKTYQEFVQYLLTLEDIKYREFNKSIVLHSKYQMIGVRLPIIRKIAKDIAKGNIEKFLEYAKNYYYEEVLIQGIVIAHIKDESIFYKYFKKYIKKIDNWALCDSFCNSIKIVQKYEDKYFKLSCELALNKKEFISRTGLVIILNHFVKDNNLMKIMDLLNKIESDKYYVNMAKAWLVCEMYTKFPIETKEFLMNNSLNAFTQNKAISKIHDSLKVSKEEKELLNKYKK